MNISPDRPIEYIKDDALGREPFVRSIASAIKGWQGSESLVIAISGPWGSGKSSVKNMLKDSLTISQSGVQAVEFNPWQWAGQDQVAEAFFREIEIALGRSPSADSKKSAALWRRYTARLKVGTFLTSSFSQVMIRASLVVLGSGATWSFMANHLLLGGVMVLLAMVVVAFGKILTWLSDFASKWGELKAANAAVYEESLEDLRLELRNQLQKLSKPLLVIIDDIDRLTAPQIGLLFQLIKANADFPNLIYLLLMEREVVEKALDLLAAGNGKYYLEKIVQIGLNLPVIPRGKLLETLERETLVLLDYSSSINEEEDQRLSSALAAISPHVKTLRAVHHFTNALAFDLSVLRGDKSLSVNKIDLLCLAAIKVFHQKVYRRLPKERSLLTQLHFSDFEKENVKRLKDFIAAQASQDEQGQLLDLLAFLFSNFPWNEDGDGNYFSYGLTARPVTEEEALTTLRICHPKNFGRYFEHSIQDDDISPEEFNELIHSLTNRAKTYSQLSEFHQRGVLLSVFERLLAYTKKLEARELAPLLTALFDVSDECLPEWESGNRSVTDRLLLFLSSSILQRIEDRAQRLRTLSMAVETSTGLYLPVAKVALEEPGSKRQAVGGLREEELTPLKQICVEKIRAWASADTLIDHPALGYLILRWQEWSKSEGCNHWVASQIHSKKGLLNLCTSLEDRHFGTDGITYSVRIDLLEKVADIKQFDQKLRTLDYDTLTNKEKEAVNRFRLAMQQRSQNEQVAE